MQLQEGADLGEVPTQVMLCEFLRFLELKTARSKAQSVGRGWRWWLQPGTCSTPNAVQRVQEPI